VQFGLNWAIGGAVGLVWLIMAKVMNISSLAALTSMALAPLIVWLVLPYTAIGPSPELVGMQVLLSLILFWRHRSNIHNLLSGAEGRISQEQGRKQQD
jgi:glycerol-3-phosphate acyltransferase PlsY